MIDIGKKIYLATPYSHKDKEVRQQRYEKITEITSLFMSKGYIVFSPITYAHPISDKYELPKDWLFWERMGRAFVSWSDVVAIYAPEGYKNSVGVMAELDIASKLNKDIVMIDELGEIIQETNND